MIIAFEGSHRSGKGTQIELLRERLDLEGKKVIVFHEPTGTEEGNQKFLADLFSLTDLTIEEELRRFQKEREEFYRELNKRQEENPELVILVDRTVLSLEIQRIKGANEKEVRKLQEGSLSNYDLIFVLDVGREGIEKGCGEIKRRNEKSRASAGFPETGYHAEEFNPYRESDLPYHRSLIRFYHRLAEGKLFPEWQEKIIGIDALREREIIAEEIYTKLQL